MNTKNTLPAVALLLDSNRGVYIPQNFVTECMILAIDGFGWSGVTVEDIATLAMKDGDDNFVSPYDIEHYWETWGTVCNNATFTENGHVWRLYQDGDLWAICDELMTDEEKENFGFDVDEDDEEDEE